MFASYQNSKLQQNDHSTCDGSITELDFKPNTNANLLSYFNFMSSNRYHKFKYYAITTIIGALSGLILIILLHTTSNASNTAPLLSPTNDNVNIDLTSTKYCENKNYLKTTSKELYTQAFGGIIKHVDGAKKYEASGVIYDSSRDVYWVVFDSLYGIGKITSDMTRNDNNLLVISNVNGINENEFGLESGYEGITRDHDTDIFYLLTEAVEFTNNNGETIYHPVIRSVTYDEKETYQENQICAVDFLEASGNKGFESINLITIDGQKYFVGLCEGNYCEAGKKGRKSGHGRMVLVNFEPKILTSHDQKYKYLSDLNIDCLYTVIDKYKLPNYINFQDYSAFHFQPKHGQNDGLFDLVVVSQENSTFWLGEVEWTKLDNGPNFDVNKKDGKMYAFPRNDNCERIFCNVEGVTFSNNNQLVAVSDKAKGGGAQEFVCGQYDQSIHIFQT